jgi:osmotically-inducible protein OsmY
MKKFTFGFILGIVITVTGVWFYGQQRVRARETASHQEGVAAQAKEMVQNAASSISTNAENLKGELAEKGKVVRQKVQDVGDAIADATADARTTATIKGKYLGSADLSVMSISVNTTGGKVTLSGTVTSPENLGKAIKLAADTEGVNEVISTLQVKK